MFNIIELGSIGGGGSAPVLPDGWDSGWMLPPTYDATSVNGKTDICGIVCNVLDIGDRNYFSCLATGAYTVNVYTDATATTLISTQNVATNTQANWQIDYAACTHQLDSETRQAWIEIVPQSGQVISSLTFYVTHPSSPNVRREKNFPAVVGRFPYATAHGSGFLRQTGVEYVDVVTASLSVVSFCEECSTLRSLSLVAPNATNCNYIIYSAGAIKRLVLDLPSATSLIGLAQGAEGLTAASIAPATAATTTNIFGAGSDATSCVSLSKLLLTGLQTGFVLRYTAMQAPELNALFTSLGTASGAQTIDVRNNPGSATCDTSIAVVKGYTVLTA